LSTAAGGMCDGTRILGSCSCPDKKKKKMKINENDLK
jgi:hypothetical protein